MKQYSLTIAACLISLSLFAQRPEAPAMSRLAKMKSYSESQFKIWFSKEDKTARDSSDKAVKFIGKYNELKVAIDELVVQLKGDMVLANSRKRLKQLNQGIQDPNSWYGKKFTEINTHFSTYVQEFEPTPTLAAATITALTGIFTAAVGVVTSLRDHRLEKVKLLNEQLEGLRLKPYYELLAAKGKD